MVLLTQTEAWPLRGRGLHVGEKQQINGGMREKRLAAHCMRICRAGIAASAALTPPPAPAPPGEHRPAPEEHQPGPEEPPPGEPPAEERRWLQKSDHSP